MTARIDVRVKGSAWHAEDTIIDVHIDHARSLSIGESLSKSAAIALRDALNLALSGN